MSRLRSRASQASNAIESKNTGVAHAISVSMTTYLKWVFAVAPAMGAAPGPHFLAQRAAAADARAPRRVALSTPRWLACARRERCALARRALRERSEPRWRGTRRALLEERGQ